MTGTFQKIKFEILIYFMIEQNLVNLASQVEFMKMNTPKENAHCVSKFMKGKSDVQVQQNFDANIEKSYLQGLPFDHDIKFYGDL